MKTHATSYHGELGLNVWESLVVCHILESIELSLTVSAGLGEKCIAGVVVVASVWRRC